MERVKTLSSAGGDAFENRVKTTDKTHILERDKKKIKK